MTGGRGREEHTPIYAVIGERAAYLIAKRFGAEIALMGQELRAHRFTAGAGDEVLDGVAQLKRAARSALEAGNAALASGSAEVPLAADPAPLRRSPPGGHLTVAEVAERLDLSRRQVTNLCQPGGPLSATKPGHRAWLIDPASVAALELTRRCG